MAKLYPVLVIVILSFVLTCSATLYNVGDNSGWDISTDLDTWVKDKTFLVGDVLLFQYSSYHSVSEVTKDSYKGCNTTDVLQTSSNGNTTFPLTKPGDRYFVCGNKLHCLGGMKLHVHVVEAQAGAPAAAPKAVTGGGGGGSMPPGSTKSNNNVYPSSAISIPARIDVLALALLSLSAVFFVVI